MSSWIFLNYLNYSNRDIWSCAYFKLQLIREHMTPLGRLWEEESFFFPFFYSRALRFSPPSALLFLTPSHGRPNLLLTLLSGWTRGFLRGLATRSFLRWAEEWWGKWQERLATYHRLSLLWWLRMKDDITRSVVIRCHRPYWFGDRLSSGGAAAADCVCCLFSPLAFLAWCNWHRAYWSGNYCNARDSLGQRGWGGIACVHGVLRQRENHSLLMEHSYAFHAEA